MTILTNSAADLRIARRMEIGIIVMPTPLLLIAVYLGWENISGRVVAQLGRVLWLGADVVLFVAIALVLLLIGRLRGPRQPQTTKRQAHPHNAIAAC